VVIEIKADCKCRWCYRDFADHNYVKDSIDKYECPFPQQESTYGYFCGGDPRDFHPDHECCTPEEIQRHKEACEDAERLESSRDLPCPSGWIRTPDGCAHILRAPFGIGVSTIETLNYFEALETEE